MKLLFCGFQHGHILGLYEKAKKNPEVEIVACIEADEARKAALAATQNKVVLYKEGVPAPIVLEEKPTCSDWLQDLIAEIRSGENTFTESVFRSSKQALLLQKASE